MINTINQPKCCALPMIAPLPTGVRAMHLNHLFNGLLAAYACGK
ncbi:hypothetical protein C4K00_0566 [Pseudomonas synxantha]|nr:hypothetical protein C4K00_0566 [Pseudomonas synxantha]AZE76370.1 hypothetical protein C4J99_0557 [Pseudomonas synxantha]